MSGAARVARLLLYPVKSLDGQDVEAASLLPSGALAHDRAFAFFDREGAVVNAKRHAALQRLRTHVDVAARLIRIDDTIYHLDRDRLALERRVGAAVGQPVVLAENADGGYPDDLVACGPTVIGTATLEAIAGWFGFAVDDVRRRLRTNIEVAGIPPFWEDRLFGAGESAVAFAIGDVGFLGTNPCLRCAVPTRDPWSGAGDRGFAKRFSAMREAELPPWAPRDRFVPFYRVAVNTRPAAAAGGTLRLGDRVILPGPS